MSYATNILGLIILLVVLTLSVQALSVHVDNALTQAEEYLQNTVNWSRERPKIVENAAQTKYNSPRNRLYVHTTDMNSSDWIQHEYGHFVMDKIYLVNPYCILDFSTFGGHFVYDEMHCKSSAFSEGWASAFSMAVRDNFSVSGVKFENISEFENTAGGDLVKSVKTEGISVMILWDIIDDSVSIDNSPDSDDDTIYGRFDLLWDTLSDGQPNDICEFYVDWIGQSTEHTSYANDLYDVYRENGIDKACVQSYILDIYSLTGLWCGDHLKMYDVAKAVRMYNRPTGPTNDWPFSDHDLQRTAYTSLKGDIQNENGMDNWGWYVLGDYGKYDNPVIANIDDDPNQEILVTSETEDEEGRAYVLDVATENGRTYGYKNHWKKSFTNPLAESASVWDINNDNTPEMVFASDGQGEKSSCAYAYNADTGRRVWQYCLGMVQGYYGRLGNTAVADLDSDGEQEVLFTDYKPNDPGWQGKLYIVGGKSEENVLGSPINIGSAAAKTSGGAWGAVSLADTLWCKSL
jgi:hypothetical protein